MKKFLRLTLAAALGYFIAATVVLILTFGIVGALSSASGTTAVMPSEAILEIDMSKLVISEQSKETDPISALQGNKQTNLGLLKAVQAINAAATDPAVKFIFLKPDRVAGGMAGIEEVRNALEKFRASGKPVVAYTETPTNGSYYLASVADKIWLSDYKGGMNMLTGFSSQLMFLKDVLDKLGIDMQLIRHGKYKSAGEMYIQNHISPANREQNQVMINSMWNAWAGKMAASRNLSLEDFNALIDELKLNSPEDFLEYGLVDELLSKEELKERIATLFGEEEVKKSAYISLNDYAGLKVLPNLKAKEKIAVIYAEGNIVDADEPEQVGGDKFASIIADVRKDSSVVAVVLRVNSPGGSVVASDKIKTEIDLLRTVKPVIASYGNYAASGGYWISSSCDYILADESTLTGSIGVFSMIPNLGGVAKKVGVNFTTINSNKHGDMYNGMRALTEAELAYMQESVEDIYDTFTSIVAEGRDMTQEEVDEIAQGRVWAGNDALEIGLIDKIGGLEDAIIMAKNYVAGAEEKELAEYAIVEYPKPLTTLEMLMEQFGAQASVFEGTSLESVEKAFINLKDCKTAVTYARIPYEITIR